MTRRGNLGLRDFCKDLAELGWLDGRNVQVDVHWGGADMDYIRRTAAELARSKPDVIVPYATRVLIAVRNATRDIPVVFLATSDPVGLGLVQSLARPGGNLTGFMLYEVSTAGKLVQFLKEIAPHVLRVALLASPDNLSATGFWKSIQEVSKTSPIAAWGITGPELREGLNGTLVWQPVHGCGPEIAVMAGAVNRRVW